MKTLTTLKTLALSSLLVSAGVLADSGNEKTCCLADEWFAPEVTELQSHQVNAENCLPKTYDPTCCLADVWTLSDDSAVTAAAPSVPLRHSKDDFCCIADEWAVR
jgi:hypothetical protein